MPRAYTDEKIIGTGAYMDGESRPDRRVLEAWGLVIRRYRHWKRLSRRELAARSGLSPVFLGEIERGEKDPSSASLCRIAAGLDAPLAELYLRVATLLGFPAVDGDERQPALPLALHERAGEYVQGVETARDETAFDLYRAARLLRADQQVSLLVLARTLLPADGDA
jgi:transcriptional regulator with XRE-family HTH domain